MAEPVLPHRPIAPLPPDAEEVALDEAEAAPAAAAATPTPAAAPDSDSPTEYGGRKGPEPTLYGDWEKNGIISDF